MPRLHKDQNKKPNNRTVADAIRRKVSGIELWPLELKRSELSCFLSLGEDDKELLRKGLEAVVISLIREHAKENGNV